MYYTRDLNAAVFTATGYFISNINTITFHK